VARVFNRCGRRSLETLTNSGDCFNLEIYMDGGNDTVQVYGGGTQPQNGGNGEHYLHIKGGFGADTIETYNMKHVWIEGLGEATGLTPDSADVIHVEDGDLMTIEGNAGADEITLGAATYGTRTEGGANDRPVYGGDDNDIIDCVTLASTVGFKIYGDDGNDVIDGGNGPDVIFGGYGDDNLYGNGGDDTFYTIDAGDGFSRPLFGTDYVHGGTNGAAGDTVNMDSNDTAIWVENYI
jgi:Ca2+-binding RTX toxin-like protein